MKAKHFTRLRKELNYYAVQVTNNDKGTYDSWTSPELKIVLAKSPLNAAYRARKRGYGRFLSINFFGTRKEWSRFRVWELYSNDVSDIKYF